MILHPLVGWSAIRKPSRHESIDKIGYADGGVSGEVYLWGFLPATFLSFLAGELASYIEQQYRTRPNRIVVGDLFDGLFAVHPLLTNPKVFHAYIAIDPSLSWNNAEPHYSQSRC